MATGSSADGDRSRAMATVRGLWRPLGGEEMTRTGQNFDAYGRHSRWAVAIGRQRSLSARWAVAIGRQRSLSARWAVAIGRQRSLSARRAVAIGRQRSLSARPAGAIAELSGNYGQQRSQSVSTGCNPPATNVLPPAIQ